MYFALCRTLTVILITFWDCSLENTVADEALPNPLLSQKEDLNFPPKVVFFGYLQRSGEPTAALLEIEGQTLILWKGIEMNVAFEGAPKATRLSFEEIDFKNREIRLGFPKSDYLPKTCRMKSK